MHKRKVIAGAALIALGIMPAIIAVASIMATGGLPVYTRMGTGPASCGGGPCRMNLGLSLSYFVYPMSFVVVAGGVWLIAFGLTERSLISGRKEMKESASSGSATFKKFPRFMKKQNKLVIGIAALSAAGTLIAISFLYYYLPATFWSHQIQSCSSTECQEVWALSWTSNMINLLETGIILSIASGILAALGVVLLVYNFKSKTTSNLLKQ
jgi:hypothetical protein